MKHTKENDTLLIKFKRSICFFWHLKKMNIPFDKVTMLNNRYTKDKKKKFSCTTFGLCDEGDTNFGACQRDLHHKWKNLTMLG